MMDYYWRVYAKQGHSEDVKAIQYIIHPTGALEFFDGIGQPVVLYAPGIWTKVLFVKVVDDAS